MFTMGNPLGNGDGNSLAVGGLGKRLVTPFDDDSANARQVGGDHYKGVAYQHWDLCWNLRLQHLPAAISKYVTRHPKKKGREDLEKALHYAEKYMEVLGQRIETPFPRAMDDFGPDDNRPKYTPLVAAYVQREVVRYCAANNLGARESAIISLLCNPHDGQAIYEIQQMVRSLLVDTYKVPMEEAFPGEGPQPHGYVWQDEEGSLT